MKIIKLTPSQHKEGRWLVWLESGELLRVSQNEVADFGLYQDLDLDADTLARLVPCFFASMLHFWSSGLE